MRVKLTHRPERAYQGSLPVIIARAENARGNGTVFDPNLHGANALQHARNLAEAAKRIPDRISQEHAAEYSAIVVDLELRSA